MTDDLNLDSAGMSNVMSMLNRISGDIYQDGLTRLSDAEIESNFRNSHLIQKIIKTYPEESAAIAYEITNESGEEIIKPEPVLVEAVKEAMIYARLYSKCFIELDFEQYTIEPPPLEIPLKRFIIHHDLVKEGDFYVGGGERIYCNRVIEVVGNRTYAKHAKKDDVNYSDSLLQGLYQSLRDYFESNQNAKHILKNLSYLTVGIDNLGNLAMSNEGQNKIFGRLQSLNLHRNITRLLAYDKRSEQINFISQTMSGVKDVIAEIKEIFVSETDYPHEILFEIGAKQSMGTGVQNQLVTRYLWARRVRKWSLNNVKKYYEDYYIRVKNYPQGNIRIPFGLDMTELEKAELEQKAADRTQKLISSGVISANEARTGYTGDEFRLNIELDDTEFRSRAFNENDSPVSKEEQQEDASAIPDYMFWDAISTISDEELQKLGEEMLKSV